VLRISVSRLSENALRFHLEGRLVGPWVEELQRLSDQAFSDGQTVSLDLQKLLYVDPAGAALLRKLKSQNVARVNCSPFICQQLKEVSQ
jgi:ABC-type transporter Mla MlaB component